MITMITNNKHDKYVHTPFSINMITIDMIMYKHIPGCKNSFMKELKKNSKSSSKKSDENSNTVTINDPQNESKDSSDSVLSASSIVVQENIDKKSQME